jgi:hypothetical protein
MPAVEGGRDWVETHTNGYILLVGFSDWHLHAENWMNGDQEILLIIIRMHDANGFGPYQRIYTR